MVLHVSCVANFNINITDGNQSTKRWSNYLAFKISRFNPCAFCFESYLNPLIYAVWIKTCQFWAKSIDGCTNIKNYDYIFAAIRRYYNKFMFYGHHTEHLLKFIIKYELKIFLLFLFLNIAWFRFLKCFSDFECNEK